MRHVCVVLFCFAFFLFLATYLMAQDKPLAEVTGAYEFNHLSLSADGQSVSDNFPAGFDGSINVPVTRWLGAVGDFGCVRKTYTAVAGTMSASATASIWTYGGGPQLTYRSSRVQPFGRFILGEAHSSVFGSLGGSLSGVSAGASVNSFFIAPGAGADFQITHNVWLHGGVDYLRTSKDGVTVNGVRAFAGFTLRFGGIGRGSALEHTAVAPPAPVAAAAKRQPLPAPPATVPRATASNRTGANMKIDALGVLVELGRNPGAEIVDDAPNGVAALAGLHPGDVINAVDGRPVKTPMELAADLSGRQVGDKVRLGYQIRGLWQAETVVVLGNP